MGCTQETMSCLDLTKSGLRLELTRDLLVLHAFACRLLVCFVNHLTNF